MIFVSILLSLFLVDQSPEKLTLPGAMNATRVDATVACAGATSSEAFPALKKLGYASIINLRRAEEPGADIPAAREAAAAAGLKYVHLPFDSAHPDPAVVDAFLKAITDRSNAPAYIHCASANRASMMWMVKRVLIDGWDVPRASEEAALLGLTHENLKQFAIDYINGHKKNEAW
jgi:uncharacterized protein (TIGR01244 family)